MRQQAVAMSFIIIGENINRINDKYPEYIVANQNLPWDELRGLRNRIAHGYYTIDWESVWNIVLNEFPTLYNALEAIIKTLNAHKTDAI